MLIGWQWWGLSAVAAEAGVFVCRAGCASRGRTVGR